MFLATGYSGGQRLPTTLQGEAGLLPPPICRERQGQPVAGSLFGNQRRGVRMAAPPVRVTGGPAPFHPGTSRVGRAGGGSHPREESIPGSERCVAAKEMPHTGALLPALPQISDLRYPTRYFSYLQMRESHSGPGTEGLTRTSASSLRRNKLGPVRL